MNISYIISFVLVIYIGIAQCNNITLQDSDQRVATNCFYCSNCPRPFNPSSPYVSQVYSSTGWCATMSTTNSPNSAYTLGTAQPNLCYTNGCSWKSVGGVNTWVCCCNQNLCNRGPPATTTPRPVGNTCYFCATCPRPFNRYSPYVTDVYSSTGWCAKMSTSSSPNSIATRGAAVPGLCSFRGCSWKPVGGVTTWVCCCSGYRCNTGVVTSKSTIGILCTALLMIVMARKSF